MTTSPSSDPPEGDRRAASAPIAAPERENPGVPRPLALITLALASTSVGALLADLYGLMSMATFGRFITAPSLVALAVIGASGSTNEELRRRIQIGAVAGVVGTIGYDLFRLPFVPLGLRLFAPIDSYGLLLADAGMASPATNALGWFFHLSNGVTFGVMYAVVAARRHWGWGIAWAMVLETAVVVSPFGRRYALAVQPASLAAAYWGHLGFGYPLGLLVQRFDRTRDELQSVIRRPAAATLAISSIVLLVWLEPWSTSAARDEAGRLAARSGVPTAVVVRDRFVPEWLRVERGGCVHIVRNDAERRERQCFDDPGAHRVREGTRPYSGGFVYVER